MDDVKRPAPSTRPTMDIRPRPVVAQPVQRPTVPINRPSYAPALSADVPQPAPPADAPVPAPAPVETHQPAAPVADPELTHLPLPEKTKAPIAAIIVALIVSAGLIGLTVFAFMKTKSGTKTSGDKSAGSSTAAQQTVAPEEVDATQKAVDDQINTLTDDKDFNSADLSDQTLGL